MASLNPSSRRDSRVRLEIHGTDDPDALDTTVEDEPTLPWWASSALAGVGAALFGWVLLTGLALIGWGAAAGSLGGAVRGGTQIWLLAQGGGLFLDQTSWTLPPLALTLLLGVGLALLTAWVARAEAAAARAEDPDADIGRLVRNVAGLTWLSYVTVVTVVATIVGPPSQGARTLVGSALLGAVATYLGALRGARHDPRGSWPDWLRPVPRAAAYASAVLLAGGAALWVFWLIRGFGQVSALNGDLELGIWPAILVLGAELAYLPNLLLWGVAYVSGAGFRIGTDTVVAVTGSNLGALPAIPVLGALPNGTAGWPNLGWFAIPVLAGVVAAVWLMRSQPWLRAETAALSCGAAGLLAGLVVLLACALATGDLGTGRLAGVGARIPQVAMILPPLLGLTAALVGLVWGVLRARRAADGLPVLESGR
ncbi:cell division protein PerM [Granulicoccus phenolivorans]|uniref:cell division protein PerM n=1 Tax=Granulicoccus phenolivorans TaxID=266854 RepID=UPI000479CC90|nr:DUF6350 family protein [Granulicoccus phenolivorans]